MNIIDIIKSRVEDYHRRQYEDENAPEPDLNIELHPSDLNSTYVKYGPIHLDMDGYFHSHGFRWKLIPNYKAPIQFLEDEK